MNIKTKIVTALTLAVFVVPGISLAQTMSVAQLQAEIQSLTAQLQTLEAQLTTAGGATAWCYTFNANLSIGMSGSAVTAFQTALQKDGESVTVNGTFDDQTAAAVTGFQEKYQNSILAPYGLTNGTGYAGKSTRAELNSLFGCGTIPVQPVVPTPANPSPAMSVYQNSQYGVRFSYPSNYTVKYGNAAFGTSNNPLGDSGIGMKNSNLTSLVTIEMPSNSYPNTGFGGAYLNVSVGTQMTSSQCSAMNTAGSSPSSGTKTIGGVPFKWSVDGSAAAGTDFTNGSFSGYTNGMCYVLLAGGVESNGAIGNVASDGAIITAVNQNSILAALNSVLATMTFSAPVNLPPITTTTTTWAAPSINPLNPSSGPLGTMITITGSGFHNGKALMGDSDSVVWISNGSQKGVLASYQPQIDTMTVGIPYSVCQTNNAYSGAPCSSSMVLTPGNYSIYIVNGNGTSNSEPYAVTASASVPPTAYNGTVNVSLDSSTPAAGTVAAGTKNVAFATIKLTATGGNAQMQWFSVVSNSANAVRGLSNIKLFEGSTLLGSAQNLLANPSVPGGYVNVPESIPLIIQNGTSVTLTIMADVAPSANGSIDLGIGGGAGAPMSPNYSIYGNNMTVAGASSGMATMLNVSVASNSNLFNGAVPAGTSNVMIGSYAINNPSTEPVTLSQLTLDFGQSTAVLNNVGITLNGGGQIAIVPTLNLSSNDVSPSVTLNSNAVTIPAGGSVTLGVYANIGVSSPSGATETTSVKSCSAQGGISYTAYSCNAVTGYKFMVK